MTIAITVRDTIRVFDLVPTMKRVVNKILDFLLDKEENVIEKKEDKEKDNKSPPALGVKVTEVIDTKDIFGQK